MEEIDGAIRSHLKLRIFEVNVQKGRMRVCLGLTIYGRKKMLWQEREKYCIRVTRMDILRGSLSVRRINELGNCVGEKKEVDEIVLQ